MANRYLEGNFAPVTEEVTITDLEVTGSVPTELDGRYLRNGPDPLRAPDPDTYHWFTGDGMLHGIRLSDGRAVWYRNRWVRSAAAAEALGEPRPGRPVAEDDFGPNTNVVRHAGTVLALVEAGPRPYEITPELGTVGPVDFHGTLAHGYTAHPTRDPLTGELHAVSYWWGWGNQVEYTVLDTSGRVSHRRMVDTAGAPMVHGMALTERFAVVLDLPVVFDIDAATSGSTLPYSWSDAHRARIGLVPRPDAPGDVPGDVRWLDVDPCFVFHPMNAHDVVDADGTLRGLVLDVVRWDRMFEGRHHGPFESPGPSLRRWTIDLSADIVGEQILADRDLEFPRIDERLVGRPNRFGYTAVDLDVTGGTSRGGILKHDLASGTTETVDLGVGSGQNEAVFVPRDDASAEDDGWLLCLAYSPETDRSRLEIRHAQALADGPVATVELPRRVPFGFHGNWLPEV